MIYCNEIKYKLYQGDMQSEILNIEKNSVDCIITDPPYELNMYNKDWDNSGVAFSKETWSLCLDVLKPGGYLLAFGGARTFHRIACAIEDAGFEIRDTIMWLYGSGFPKSTNIGSFISKKTGDTSNSWVGWGSCLKPAFEPIILARKPSQKGLIDTVLENGVGGLNIDECRIPLVDGESIQVRIESDTYNSWGEFDREFSADTGRFPSNVIIDGSNEVIDNMPYINGKPVCRYFYCAKATLEDKEEGLDLIKSDYTAAAYSRPGYIDKAKSGDRGNPFGKWSKVKNTHPTVKPVELMQYLISLVAPQNSIILDPFMGSGSTGKAVMMENNKNKKNYIFIGIEKCEEYLPIAKARIEFGATCVPKAIEKTTFVPDKTLKVPQSVNLW